MFGSVIWSFLVVTLVIIIVGSVTSRVRNRKRNTKSTTFTNELTNGELVTSTIYNSRPEFSRPDYYHWQKDTQPIFNRNAKQKDIVDRYFIVKNVLWSNRVLLYVTLGCWLGALLLFLLSAVLPKKASDSNSFISTFAIIGGLLLVSGAVCLIIYRLTKKFVPPENRYSDAEYEKLVLERMEQKNVARLSLETLGLDRDQVAEIQPIVLHNHVCEDYSLTRRDAKFGGRLHSSTNYVVYLYFTNEQLHMFYYEFDMCCNVEEIDTREIFYTDICDIATVNTKNVIEFKDENLSFQINDYEFYIKTYNSEIKLYLDGTDANLQSLQALSQKIRERKYARR